MPSEDVQKRVEELDKQIAGLQEKRRELLRSDAQKQVRDLEHFEEMTPEERRELYQNNPEAYRHYSALKREKAEKELTAEPALGSSR